MEFIKTSRYAEGNFDKPIDFSVLRTLPKVRVSQKLEPLDEPENVARLRSYAARGEKIVPIQRVSSRDWASRTDFPNRVLLEMTSMCNLSCRMCPRHNLKRPKMHFNKDLYLKVVDELDEHGVEGVWVYHLGESILHPDWKEIVTYVGNKKNIELIWFSTNGVLFDEDCVDFILNSNVTFLNYSLHGTDERTFGYVSPPALYKFVRGHLEALLEKKKRLGRGPTLHIQMIEQERTKENVNEFLETFYPTGEIVSINTLEYANLPNNTFGLARARPPMVKTCQRISRGDRFIVSNGDIQPCDATYNSEILLGNVKNDSVFEIWNSEVRKSMLELNNKGELHKIDHCRECTDYDL